MYDAYEFKVSEASTASDLWLAGAVLRFLKENFLGGLKVVRMDWSFSESDFMV